MISLFEIGSLMLLYKDGGADDEKHLLYPLYPGSYGGKERFQRAIVEETGSRLSDAQVNEWLAEQDAYTLHKPVRKQFPRNRVFSTHPLSQFQADLCDMQALADSYVPLLRTVHIDGKDGDVVTVNYDKPHYVPVSKKYIGNILVELKTDQNENIEFTYGKTIVKLHFRPAKTSLHI